VVGYDDVELAAMTDPPLTTVHQPSYELGATAYELLRGGEPEQRSFSPHLVQRESTAVPPA
jgi:LacI family transcriptional regulator